VSCSMSTKFLILSNLEVTYFHGISLVSISFFLSLVLLFLILWRSVKHWTLQHFIQQVTMFIMSENDITKPQGDYWGKFPDKDREGINCQIMLMLNLRSGPILAVSIHSLLRGCAKIGPDTKSLVPVLLRPDFGCNTDWSLEQCQMIWLAVGITRSRKY